MATILVDYENVSSSDGLKGVKYLTQNDTLIIFYSQSCEKIRAEYIEMIEQSQCDFRCCKLLRAGKNALDFYIAVECGRISVGGETQIGIVTRDKGFSAIADYFSVNSELEQMEMQIASNVENVMLLLNAPEDKKRKRLIKENTKSLNIESEQLRIKEHRVFVEKIKRLFEGTEYEAKTDNIINFIANCDSQNPKQVYTGSLHMFGRDDGRMIYQLLKQVI